VQRLDHLALRPLKVLSEVFTLHPIAIPPSLGGLDFTFCLLYKSYIRFV
jgi:hypothetical protein